VPVNDETTIQTASFQNPYSAYRPNKEINVTYFKLQESVVAVAVTGDTFPYKRYLNNEDLYQTKDEPPKSIQCPFLYRYTSTENNSIQNLHKYAINHGKQRNIQNFEDEYPNPWRTNGKAYVYWVVGPKEVQTNQSKYLSINYFIYIY
jgi:hypothetical protein